MSNFNYDSYCGLYCGACSVLRAFQTGIKDKFAEFFSDEAGLELKCYGCKTDTVFSNCVNCDIRKCATEKNVERCSDCKDFPCNMMSVEQLKALFEKLPHLTMAPNNVEFIRGNGVEKWLSEQVKLWKCPECQTEFSWYAAKCSKCGKDLDKVKSFKGYFDKSIFQELIK